MILGKLFKSMIMMLLASVLLVPVASAQQSHAEAAPDFELDDFDPDIMRVDDARLERALQAYQADESLQLERPEWEPEIQAFEPRERRSGPNPIAQAIASFFQAIGPALGLIHYCHLKGLDCPLGERAANPVLCQQLAVHHNGLIEHGTEDAVTRQVLV